MREALHLYDELDDQRGKANVFGQLGAVHRLSGVLRTALEYTNRSLDHSRAANDQHQVATALSEVSSLHERLGEHALALETARAALAICRETGSRSLEPNILRTLGAAEYLGGHLDDAEASLSEAVRLAREMDMRGAEADALHVRGATRLRAGRTDEAHSDLVAALEIYAGLGSRRGYTSTLNEFGTLVRDRDPLSARRIHLAALRAARAMANPVLEASSWQGLGRSFVASGDVARGVTRLRRAVDIYRAIGDHEARAVEELITELEER